MRTGSRNYFLPRVRFPTSPPLKRGVGRNWEECQFPRAWGSHFPRSIGVLPPQFPTVPQGPGKTRFPRAWGSAQSNRPLTDWTTQ